MTSVRPKMRTVLLNSARKKDLTYVYLTVNVTLQVTRLDSDAFTLEPVNLRFATRGQIPGDQPVLSQA